MRLLQGQEPHIESPISHHAALTVAQRHRGSQQHLLLPAVSGGNGGDGGDGDGGDGDGGGGGGDGSDGGLGGKGTEMVPSGRAHVRPWIASTL